MSGSQWRASVCAPSTCTHAITRSAISVASSPMAMHRDGSSRDSCGVAPASAKISSECSCLTAHARSATVHSPRSDSTGGSTSGKRSTASARAPVAGRPANGCVSPHAATAAATSAASPPPAVSTPSIEVAAGGGDAADAEDDACKPSSLRPPPRASHASPTASTSTSVSEDTSGTGSDSPTSSSGSSTAASSRDGCAATCFDTPAPPSSPEAGPRLLPPVPQTGAPSHFASAADSAVRTAGARSYATGRSAGAAVLSTSPAGTPPHNTNASSASITHSRTRECWWLRFGSSAASSFSAAASTDARGTRAASATQHPHPAFLASWYASSSARSVTATASPQ
eukprot:365569-Chlamydomonas_euryale.AAC.11